MPIRADARVLGARLEPGQEIEYRLRPGRHAYLVPASGAVSVNGVRVGERDGAAIRDETVLRLTAPDGEAELVLVDCSLSGAGRSGIAALRRFRAGARSG